MVGASIHAAIDNASIGNRTSEAGPKCVCSIHRQCLKTRQCSDTSGGVSIRGRKDARSSSNTDQKLGDPLCEQFAEAASFEELCEQFNHLEREAIERIQAGVKPLT
ncbi:hypothetical protein Pst134EB_016844 [Puccinia striiformis f. sp. tritici]|nr:hypothetical protein Pst134EB_016844 [Puccinia striiformis f. sp. tritici]